MKSILICLLMIPAILSKDSYADTGTRKIMREVVDNYVGLIPYIYGDKEENKKDIAKKMKNLEDSFQASKHNKMLTAPNFAPLAESMSESFREIHTYYKETDDDFAKYRLLRLTSTCVACHTQLPRSKFKPVYNRYKKITDKYLKDDADKAYLSFFFRDYDQAASHLKSIFEKKKNKYSLTKLVKVYLVNLNDKDQASSYLGEVADSEQYNSSLRDVAKKWKLELDTSTFSRAVAMNKETWVRGLISKHLVPRRSDLLNRVSNKSVIIAYKMQRILYNYLVYHPNSQLVPELLYWIGILENKERDIDLYTLGEMYFEQCIIKYPHSQIAPQCYGAYKEAIYEGFTGSSGTDVPQEYLSRLKKYKALVFKDR